MNYLSHPIPASEPITLIQFSDVHLNATPKDTYNDIYPEQHLQRCLDWLNTQHYDYLLLTGDLVHHGYTEAYSRLNSYLNTLSKPWQWLPGNHDDKTNMVAVNPQDIETIRLLEIGGWDVILLDSTCLPDGEGAGSIGQKQMHELDQYLQQASQHNAPDTPPKPVLIALHHNPIPINDAEPDPIMLGNKLAFCELVAKFDQVKAITFGHVHQVLDKTINNQRFFSAPATSVQFINHTVTGTGTGTGTGKAAIHPNPGVRIIKLHPEGTLDTEVIWLPK